MIYANGVAIVALGNEVHLKFLCNAPTIENLENGNEIKATFQMQEVAHIILPFDAAKHLRDGITENIANHEAKTRTQG